jgi:hypothetical protein
MVKLRHALFAGFVATFVASAMIQMNNAIGKIPEVHVASSLSSLVGSPDRLPGWLLHFFLGIVVFPIIFAVIERKIPLRAYAIKGLIYGVLLWLGMMLIFMPLNGAGPFGLVRGGMVPVVTLALNLAYGLILGIAYGWDQKPAGNPAVPS